MYVDLDEIINSMHPDQKLNLPYKPSVQFFVENIDYLVDLRPRTMTPIAWDLKYFKERKQLILNEKPLSQETL